MLTTTLFEDAFQKESSLFGSKLFRKFNSCTNHYSGNYLSIEIATKVEVFIYSHFQNATIDSVQMFLRRSILLNYVA